MKSPKEYMVKEDKVDAMKHDKFNDIFQALERLNSEYDELDALDRDENPNRCWRPIDQLTTMRKHVPEDCIWSWIEWTKLFQWKVQKK